MLSMAEARVHNGRIDMAENDAPKRGMNFDETEWEFLAAIDALEYLNFDTSMASVRDDAAEIATIIIRRQRADLAAPDAAQRCQHLAERDALGEAIAAAAIKAGIIDGKQPLLGPQLVMLCHDLASTADIDAVRQARREAWRETLEILQSAIEQLGFEAGAQTALGWLQTQLGVTKPLDEIRKGLRVERVNDAIKN